MQFKITGRVREKESQLSVRGLMVRAYDKDLLYYSERYHYGEKISTGFVESTVNQIVSKRMVKKQQMRWTKKGAHLLLQVRTQVLNDDWRDTFSRWYPHMKPAEENIQLVA